MTSASPPAGVGRLARFAGPGVVAMAALAMLAWSWGTWPDPLVDFGAQLYVPWQLAAGRVLYRDIAYFNGPLSSYLNATAFLIGGVSLRTLVLVNLLIVAATMVVAYRLTVRAAGRSIAIIGGITFALVFAFGQTVLIGNYNWVTPYTHELTHGTALGLAAIAAAARLGRTGQSRWIAIAGLLLGAVFLTKAEPTAAAFAALLILSAGVPAGACPELVERVEGSGRDVGETPGGHASPASDARSFDFAGVPAALRILVGCTLIAPIIAFAFLATKMPAAQAFRGVLGSWPWAFDRRVTSLIFYRNVTGLNDIAGNLATMLRWTMGYAVLLGTGVGIGLLCKTTRSGRVASVLAFVLVLSTLIAAFNQINWTGMLTPLPLCLIVVLTLQAVAILRRRIDRHRGTLRIALIVFSMVLLAKMGLKPHVYHYGFVLAWPGTIVLIAWVGSDLPRWIIRRGGSGGVVIAIGLAAWLVGVFAVLNRDAINFDSKRFTVAPGTPDSFLATSCGQEVQSACDEIRQLTPANGTVAVFPQGLMINYLTRRANSIPNVNFMPPEVLAAGEGNILSALKQHPPDVIVVTSSVVQGNRFTLDGRDDYGGDVLAWIKQNYQPVGVVTLPKPAPTIYRFVISRLKARTASPAGEVLGGQSPPKPQPPAEPTSLPAERGNYAPTG